MNATPLTQPNSCRDGRPLRIGEMVRLCAWLIGWGLTSTTLNAQPSPPEELNAAVTTEAAAVGITILGNPTLSFTTIQDYTNGVTLDHTTLRLSLAPGVRWSLQVRASGDLVSGTQSIPISTIRIQPVGVSANSGIISLNTAEQTLISGLLDNLLSLTPTFRYTATGGAAFYKPAGQYSTTLIFTYTPL